MGAIFARFLLCRTYANPRGASLYLHGETSIFVKSTKITLPIGLTLLD